MAHIASGNPIIASFPVYAELDAIPIVRVPDALMFENGLPLYLLELKMAGCNVDKLWSTERLQSSLYAYCLDEMGFDCSQLQMIIPKILRSKSSPKKTDLHRPIFEALRSRKIQTLERAFKGTFKIHLVQYERRKVVELRIV